MSSADPFADLNDGVFPSQWLAKALDAGLIDSGSGVHAPAIQPASLDLHLDDVAYRLRCSFLPGVGRGVEDRLSEFAMGHVDLAADGAVLEVNRPYLVPLVERLALPGSITAKANPKSSTGRIDVFARVITDHGQRFDAVPAGYQGRLYLELVSNTFTVKVHPGLALSQLRLMKGSSQLSDGAIAEEHQRHPLLYKEGLAVAPGDLYCAGGLFVGLDFEGGAGGVVGYRAKRNSRLLDLSAVGGHDPEDYWEPVVPERGTQVVLEPEEFYLLLSQEAVSIPPHLAGEMTAYDPTSGELRTHYAGFFDPGFGFDEFRMAGARATLEIRAHDAPFVVQHGQRVCKIAFDELVEPADMLYGESIGSNYQAQQTTLSKYFRRPEPERQLRLDLPTAEPRARRKGPRGPADRPAGQMVRDVPLLPGEDPRI